MEDSLKIWTEKYRPNKFSEVYGHKKIVKKVKAFVEKGNMPHLLLAGPAGIGKTTLSLVIAKELFGDNWRSNFLETNASDERGIDVIRNKIKDFARTKAVDTNLPKIIYLDECDSLTKEAQQALRRTMETYSGTARFVLSCNYSSKLIDPIQSRCAVFRFKPLLKEDIAELVDSIASAENLKVTDDAREALFDVSGGDVRRVVNTMQSCSVVGDTIDKEAVYEVNNFVKPKDLDIVLLMAIDGKFVEAREKLLKIMLNNGLSGMDIIKQIQSEILRLDLESEVKLKMIEKCGETEFRLVEGSDEFIQLEAMLASFGLFKK
ncbi:replication factor C small subunit [Candidatus Woesearchaeota archaeon]|jgi:replication factor C small subunit|nr:replication factor C small subunit [Candidatus Woesearchaeota archaeon]MBT3438743.1 replication factor C small subunit [Candidatus Woesearchaeota archaeon]MBT4058440.1 replication factor C small subunit [Candidatus Woesearchaeota archaeon]MBT4208771.1 replication factor C small subunit [Candidatus Woesearchaeota archaeon]MBT4733140.1 replication factor C small subunit [Candidatus Woesearchaeota archaeon]